MSSHDTRPPKALPPGEAIGCLPESPRTQVDGWDPRECVGTPHCPPRCPVFVDKTGVRTIVRPMRSFDREPLVGMYETFDRAHVAQSLPPATTARTEQWLDMLTAEGHNVVAERHGELVGHAVYTPTDDPEPELAVFVDPDYHDRGIGTELCKHVIAHAAANGHEAIVLEVERTNHAALSVYRRLGFETTETNRFVKSMRLSLSKDVATIVQLPPNARRHYER
ncbi:GNAT family N-acetyltransferase [Halalkalirubrum salinum]|uniref:GNAT family N-acetyltransferase n=1 Tax=Halalkalirubrum salinum TaxID=2563889 RepID=UPI0010FB920A|nr:GNAT family N-acetyltransferase [Halalkalirubrum salinum]